MTEEEKKERIKLSKKLWQQNNKDKVNAIKRRYYAKNKEKMKALRRKRYLENKEHIKDQRQNNPEVREKYLAYQREQARINSKKRAEASRLWKINNPEKYRQQLDRRIERRKQNKISN